MKANAIAVASAIVLLAASRTEAETVILPKWGPGCNRTLLEGPFSPQLAPLLETGESVQAIEAVIAEMKRGYAGTVVTAEVPDPVIDTPGFVSRYLREFGDPAGDWSAYDFRFERLLTRISWHPAMMENVELDWDVWRAWLLFENQAHPTDSYLHRSGSWNLLDGAPGLLMNYLSHNAGEILGNGKRRDWWMTQLTRDLDAPGGRPYRRWFLLHLLAAADPSRKALEAVPVPEVFVTRGDRRIPLRQPHPLDPFLIVKPDEKSVPSFETALRRIASDQGLGLEVFLLDPAGQGPTRVHTITLEKTKWPIEEFRVINQESWSGYDPSRSHEGYEWGPSSLRTVGQRGRFASLRLPEDREDGVFFFVFDRRLFVWPKSRMDAAILTVAGRAGMLGEELRRDLEGRGFKPLQSTFVVP